MIINPETTPKCPSCNGVLTFVNNGYKSDEGSTEVFVELKGYCINPKCPIYAGRLDGDKVVINEESPIAEIVRNKVG